MKRPLCNDLSTPHKIPWEWIRPWNWNIRLSDNRYPLLYPASMITHRGGTPKVSTQKNIRLWFRLCVGPMWCDPWMRKVRQRKKGFRDRGVKSVEIFTSWIDHVNSDNCTFLPFCNTQGGYFNCYQNIQINQCTKTQGIGTDFLSNIEIFRERNLCFGIYCPCLYQWYRVKIFKIKKIPLIIARPVRLLKLKIERTWRPTKIEKMKSYKPPPFLFLHPTELL